MVFIGTQSEARATSRLAPFDHIEPAPSPSPWEDLIVAWLILACMRKLARSHRDDPAFKWEAYAFHAANLLRMMEPGIYEFEDRNRRRFRWPRPELKAILCGGREPIFAWLTDVPDHVRAAVLQGIGRAASLPARIRHTGEDIGRALGVTFAEREALRLWQLGCMDCTRRQRAQRAKDSRNAKLKVQRAEKRAQENTPLSNEQLQPWLLAGKSRRWFYGQPQHVKEALIAQAHAETSAVRNCTAHVQPRLHRRTYRHTGSAASHISPEKPWVMAQLSRATWYRREAEKRSQAPREDRQAAKATVSATQPKKEGGKGSASHRRVEKTYPPPGAMGSSPAVSKTYTLYATSAVFAFGGMCVDEAA